MMLGRLVGVGVEGRGVSLLAAPLGFQYPEKEEAHKVQSQPGSRVVPVI